MIEIEIPEEQKIYTKQDYVEDPIYQNFIHSLKSEASRTNYSQFLIKYYLSVPPNNILSLSQILKKDRKVMEQEIIFPRTNSLRIS